MSDVTVSMSMTRKEQGALYMAHLVAKKKITVQTGQLEKLKAALDRIYQETNESPIANIARSALDADYCNTEE